MTDLIVNEPRVWETSTTTGTGTLNLAGASTAEDGLRTFVGAGIGGKKVYYMIAHQGADEWEKGIGTVTDASPDTLSRDKIYESSNSGSAVNFSAGTKDVFLFNVPWSCGMNRIDKSASFTAEPGNLYVLNLNSLGQNLVVTFPSSPQLGDKFACEVGTTNTTDTGSSTYTAAPYWCAEPAASTPILGSSYSAVTGASGHGSGEYGLWQLGERIDWTYNGSTWVPHFVTKLAQIGHMRRYAASSKDQTFTGSANHKIEIDTAVDASGVDCDTTNYRMRIRRRGRYIVIHGLRADSVGTTISDGARLASVAYDPGSGDVYPYPNCFAAYFASAAAQRLESRGVAEVDFDEADLIELRANTPGNLTIDCESSAASAPNLQVREVA